MVSNTRNRNLPFAVRYLTTNGKQSLVLSLPVRP